MSTIFTLNPIKINIISIKNTIKRTIVFIGIVPKNVQDELTKIEKTGKHNPKNPILTKFYGKHWDIRLGIKKSLIGGDEFSFDEEIDLSNKIQSDEEVLEVSEKDTITPEQTHELESELQQLNTGANTTNIKETRKEIEKQITSNSSNINTISLDELDEIEIPQIEEESTQRITQITALEIGKFRIQFIFADPYVSLYPEDNMLDFKKKIYTILNIPIYRQHIWYVYQGRTYPLNYSILYNQSLLYINIQEMLNNYNNENNKPQMIENIPVDTTYYMKKSFLKVVTNDTFSILDEYFHKYGVTEYNLIDLDDFVKDSRVVLKKIISERYQLELIYYSFILLYWPMLSLEAFTEYIKYEANIPKIYPELQQPIQELTQIYKVEKKIMDTKMDLITNPKKKDILKKIRNTITNSITEAIISVLKYQNSKDTILFIRNLFDKMPLTQKVVSCKCYINHNGKKIIFNKVYKNQQFIKEDIPIDSIMFKIKPNPESIKTITLSFFKNGNYVIKSTWPEEKQYDFDDIFNICKNETKSIIDQINNYGSLVLVNQKTLPIMNKNNSKFTEIGMSMFYKKPFTQNQFDTLKNIMKDYKLAGIVRDRLNEKSISEYYFSKGMYQFNANRIERVITINNYYDFLTDGIINQKWFTLFEKTRITKLIHRFSDIKIEIIGIKEKEFFIFYNFIMTLFYLYNLKCQNITECKKEEIKKTTDRTMKKTLRNLKEQDPVLYNFKKYYKTENVYSKICQRPRQPLLLTKQGFDNLPKDKKKNVVKYWNFTSNKDAYYTCPNPKYPYLDFRIKRHPKDYCIPCCRKMQVAQSETDAKRIIYDICLKNHKYVKEERNITLGSRYIMSYGKDIEPGRLSRLPENSLEPLFYETYSIASQGINQEFVTADSYYIYGVEQNYKDVCALKNVGVFNILVHALEIEAFDLIKKIINLLKASPNKFRILLDGDISKYFKNINTFIETLKDLFLSPNPLDDSTNSNEIPWNDIFINIIYLFMNINTIIFRHKRRDAVKLVLPSYITNKEKFMYNGFTNLIIFQKRNKYYPIYLLNTDVFFKAKMFTKKIFKYNDPIMEIIGLLVAKYFSNKIKNNVMDTINLTTINEFIKHSSYTLHKLYVNNSNMCYYVHIKSKQGKNIYVAIELSYHLESEKINTTYEMFSRNKAQMDINTLLKFMVEFNNWIAVKSEKEGMIDVNADKKLPLEQRVQPIFPYIKIYKWLVLSNVSQKISDSNMVIGFVCNEINYYINNIKLEQALKIKKVPIIEVFYDPDEVNKNIFIRENAINDTRSKLAGKSIYHSNLYQLLLLEFMTVFNKQKNISLRKKIKGKLLGNLNQDFDDLMIEIEKLVPECDDYIKLKTQIYEFINNHHSKNLLFREIDDTFYKFDRSQFEYIKKLPNEKIYKELEKLSHKFVYYGNVDTVKDFEFPNMFVSCQLRTKKNKKYCKNNKLIIEKKKLKQLLEIMTADILNPVKERWIFSNVFSDNVINFFKFIKRPDEFITIEVKD